MSTNINTTITVPAHAPPEADMTILAPAILYTSLMMLMGACGNAVVCYVYGFRWQSTVTKVFIFSLALLDLSNSLVCMPTEIVMLVKIVSFDSPAWCKLSRFLTYTLNGSSSLILVSIALDRWYKVCRPMNHFFTVRRAKLTCAGAVVLAASVSWPALVLYGNLAVPVAGSDVMGVTCLVSDDFIDSWWPLVFYALYFAMYLVLVVALTVLYSLIAVRIVQLKKRQRARVMSPVAATGLRTSRICSTSQELVLVEASHHEHHNNHHNHDNNNGGGGGGKCGVKIQMINEEAELLEEEDLVQSACVEIVPALERIQEENDRRRSVTFRLPRHSGTTADNMSEDPPGGVPQNESEASQSASAGDTVDANNSRTDGEKTVNSPVISRSDAEKTLASCGIPIDRNSDTIQANFSDNAQSPNGPCVSKISDQNSSAVAQGDGTRLQSHPKQSQASVRKKAATKGCQNGDCVDNVVDGSVDDVVDGVIHDDPQTKWMRIKNLPVPHHEENRLLSRLSSHSHADSPDEDTDSFEQGIHFVSQSEICWQHNPIAEPVVINNDVTVTDVDDVKGEFSDVKNVVINHDVKDVVINHDVSVLKDESADELDELGTSAVWLLGEETSPGGKAKLEKALSDTAAVSAHKARGSSSPKKKKAHKTVSESQAWLQVPGQKPTDGGTSSRNSFLLPPGGYPGGHTPTSRLPTPTGSATPDAADNRPVRLSGAMLLERLNKKMAYRPAKTTRMLFAISIVFVLSFLPFFCIVITRAVRGKAFLASLTDVGVVLISIFIRSSFLSNAANPIIYGLCNKQFRTECRRLARRVSGKEHGVTLRVIEQTDDALGSENS